MPPVVVRTTRMNMRLVGTAARSAMTNVNASWTARKPSTVRPCQGATGARGQLATHQRTGQVGRVLFADAPLGCVPPLGVGSPAAPPRCPGRRSTRGTAPRSRGPPPQSSARCPYSKTWGRACRGRGGRLAPAAGCRAAWAQASAAREGAAAARAAGTSRRPRGRSRRHLRWSLAGTRCSSRPCTGAGGRVGRRCTALPRSSRSGRGRARTPCRPTGRRKPRGCPTRGPRRPPR